MRPIKEGSCFVDFKEETSMHQALSKQKLTVKGVNLIIKQRTGSR